MPANTSTPLSDKSKIDYDSNLLLLGSCFAENIGDKFEYFKFQNSINSFGILFHPKAIENLITHSINRKEYTVADVFFYNERWHCFDAHSDLSSNDKEELLTSLNQQVTSTKTAIENASHLIITVGTAWVYRFITSNKIVGNCHKIPQKQFTKELLSVAEVTDSLKNIVSQVKTINPSVHVIFTVSPIRHLKDGFVENSRSKAHLTASIHDLITASNGLHYFPSYEIMMDDLRDYRFYTADMLHPSNIAIHYIWEQFSQVWIAPNTQHIQKKVDTVQRGLAHRPFNASSEQHQKFLASLTRKMEDLEDLHDIRF
ncbi:MAG: GSCFA domain-containing protein [Flavobacteriaceae bacterium]|nr:MAG: GSCFA domain-containing protein [Flavobacteriaceae bacterium]